TITVSPTTRLVANRPQSISGETRAMMTRCRPSEGGSCIGAFISSYAAVEYLVISFEPRAPDYSTIHPRCNSREFTTYMKFPRYLVSLLFWCCAGVVIWRIACL